MIKFICTSGNTYEITREDHSTHRDRFDAATWYLNPPCTDSADRKELEDKRVVANFAGFGGEKCWSSTGKSIYQKVWYS